MTIHVHIHGDPTIAGKLEMIMLTQAELAAQVATIGAQVTKIGAETTKLLAKIDELNAVIAAGAGVTPELQAAVDEVAAQAKTVDDLVPDVPAP
jgi:uncharacterized hydantoinase/oxoprolinase family protein